MMSRMRAECGAFIVKLAFANNHSDLFSLMKRQHLPR